MDKLPYITKDIKGISGTIREKPEYFMVEELPAYEPEGKGEHLYINFTKKELSTPEFQKQLAFIFNLNQNDIGVAGLKDKHAITTQTASICFEGKDKSEEAIKEVTDKIEKEINVKVNWYKFHTNKLKPGHLRGNKFTITITNLNNIEEAFEKANNIASILKQTGIPNFYGEQRFGMNGDNAEKGLAILKGELKVRDRFEKKFLLSSFQSQLCNKYLIKRIEMNFSKLIKGDICKKHDTGGLFVVEDLEKEQTRYNNKEISFTAPMFGEKLWFSEGESGEIEKSIIQETGLTEEQIKRLGTGTRRLGRLLVDDLQVEKTNEGIKLSFTLLKGSFATIVLREFCKND